MLRGLGGSARRKDLARQVGWRPLKRAVAAGLVVRCGRGYALATTDLPKQRATQLQGVRSHTTAAEHWGLALPPESDLRVQITIPRRAQRADVPGDVRLRYRELGPADVVDGVTTPLRTVLDCLVDQSLRTALSVGDSALRARLVAFEELAAAVAALRGPGSLLARTRLAMLDARSANAFESSCRAILLAAGITGFEPQVGIRHRRQWVGRVDLAHRRLRIVIECDGFDTHGGRDAFVSDLVRHTSLVAAGWRPLRITWEQVMFRSDWVLEVVRDTIAAAEGALIAEQSAERPAAHA